MCSPVRSLRSASPPPCHSRYTISGSRGCRIARMPSLVKAVVVPYLDAASAGDGLPGALRFSLEDVREDPDGCVATVRASVQWHGGVLAPGEPEEGAADL